MARNCNERRHRSPPLPGHSLQSTREVSLAAFPPRHVTDTPSTAQGCQVRLPPDDFLRRIKSAVLPFRIPIRVLQGCKQDFPSSSRRGGGHRSSLFYSRPRPAPVPGSGCARKAARPAPGACSGSQPSVATRRRLPDEKPRVGRRSAGPHRAAAGPGTCKMVSGSCSARLCVCARACV